jgi:hypothetical protein
MTAVISPPDSIVSQPEQTRTFFARREELVLVMKTEYPVRGPSGEQVDLSEGIRLQFQAGMLRVPLHRARHQPAGPQSPREGRQRVP